MKRVQRRRARGVQRKTRSSEIKRERNPVGEHRSGTAR